MTNFERFENELKRKVERDENYTMEDRNDFYACLYNFVKENGKKEAYILKKLIYVFDDCKKFGEAIQEFELSNEVNFARHVVKLNPNVIKYFDESVRKDQKILDYLAYKAPLKKGLDWPIIALDERIVEQGVVVFDKKAAEEFGKRCKTEKEKRIDFSGKGGVEFI